MRHAAESSPVPHGDALQTLDLSCLTSSMHRAPRESKSTIEFGTLAGTTFIYTAHKYDVNAMLVLIFPIGHNVIKIFHS